MAALIVEIHCSQCLLFIIPFQEAFRNTCSRILRVSGSVFPLSVNFYYKQIFWTLRLRPLVRRVRRSSVCSPRLHWQCLSFCPISSQIKWATAWSLLTYFCSRHCALKTTNHNWKMATFRWLVTNEDGFLIINISLISMFSLNAQVSRGC